jgi:hypothetical protein
VLGQSDRESRLSQNICLQVFFSRYYLLFKAGKPRGSDAHRHDDKQCAQHNFYLAKTMTTAMC